MPSEINFDSLDTLDQYYELSVFETASFHERFHELIFCPPDGLRRFDLIASFIRAISKTEQRIQRVSYNNSIIPMGKVSVEGGVSYEWGGSDGGGVSGYVSGSASDDNGNKAEVEVQVNGDGSGKVEASVSHDEDTNG